MCRSGGGLVVLPLVLGLFASSPAHAQTVHGRLLEQGSREPIAHGLVTLLDQTNEEIDRSETDSLGTFVLRSPDPGLFLVRAERLGYRAKTDGILELGEGGEITIDFFLLPEPILLEGLEATGERLDPETLRDREYLKSQGFYDREKMGFGHFIGPEDIKWHMFDTWDLFRKIPGLSVSVPPRSAIGSPCVYLDGIRVHTARDGDWSMEDDIQIEGVVGVEVYTRTKPLQYGGLDCGSPLILVWTKG